MATMFGMLGPGSRRAVAALLTGLSLAAVAQEPPGAPPPASSVAAPAPVTPAAAAPAAGTPGTAGSPSPSARDVTKLGGVNVKGKRDLLRESQEKLDRLKKSLPNLDSDGPKHEDLGQRIVDRSRKYLSDHSDPNKLSQDSQQFLEKQKSADPNSQQKSEVSAPRTTQSKDYVDPLCQTGSCPP